MLPYRENIILPTHGDWLSVTLWQMTDGRSMWKRMILGSLRTVINWKTAQCIWAWIPFWFLDIRFWIIFAIVLRVYMILKKHMATFRQQRLSTLRVTNLQLLESLPASPASKIGSAMVFYFQICFRSTSKNFLAYNCHSWFYWSASFINTGIQNKNFSVETWLCFANMRNFKKHPIKLFNEWIKLNEINNWREMKNRNFMKFNCT